MIPQGSSRSVDQGLLFALNLVVSLIARAVPPLGVALIAASPNG